MFNGEVGVEMGVGPKVVVTAEGVVLVVPVVDVEEDGVVTATVPSVTSSHAPHDNAQNFLIQSTFF